MVGAEKWSQVDIDTIFWLKYEQGWSEPSITDFVAHYCRNHQNVKVAGIRYVLRSRRPSVGIPDSPCGLQAQDFLNFQTEVNQADLPLFCIENQQRVLAQEALQQKTPYDDKNLSALHNYEDKQSYHQNNSWTVSEDSAKLSNAIGNEITLKSRPWTQNNSDYFSAYIASQTPDIILQEPLLDFDIKNDNREDALYSFNIHSEGEKQMIDHQESKHVLASTNQTNDTITDSIAPTSLSGSLLSLDSNPHRLEGNESQLEFGYNPVEIAHSKNISMEQQKDEYMPELFCNTPSEHLWNRSSISDEQGGTSKVESPVSRLSPHSGYFNAETSQGGSYQSSSLMNAKTNFDYECLELSQKTPHCGRSKPLPNSRVKKIKKSKSCFKAPGGIKHQESVPSNRFGGTRGSPLDELQKSVNIDLTSFVDPLCDARLYEDDCLIGNLGPFKYNNLQNTIPPDVETKLCEVPPLPNSMRADFALKEAGLSGKDTSPVTAIDSSIINLHNPEFYQPFMLPLDSRDWNVDEIESKNFTLHSDTPTGRVIVNMFNPVFHSGFSINKVFEPSACSPELLHILRKEKQSRTGEGET